MSDEELEGAAGGMCFSANIRNGCTNQQADINQFIRTESPPKKERWSRAVTNKEGKSSSDRHQNMSWHQNICK